MPLVDPRRTVRPLLAQAWWRGRRPGAARLLRRLRETQWLPEERLREIQLGQLAVLAEALGRTPIRALDELGEWPITRPADLAAPLAGQSAGRRVSTSGTGGSPRSVVLSPEAVRWQEGVEERAREWLGVGGGRPRVWACCVPGGRLRRAAMAARNTRLLDARALAEDPELRGRVAAELAARPPDLLQGVSNVLAALAREIAARRDGRATGTVSLSAGNHLTPWYRRAMEALEGPVRQRYAAVEVGLIASECERGLLHVNAESVLTEVVRGDDAPAPAGEPGELLVTSLRNRAAPLVRYALGDVAKLPGTRCPCGRGLPVIELLGRREEMILPYTGGDPVPPQRLFAALDGPGGRVADARVEAGANGPVVRVVVPPGGPREEAVAAIGADVGAVLGTAEPAEVRVVPAIETGPSGKTRLVRAAEAPAAALPERGGGAAIAIAGGDGVIGGGHGGTEGGDGAIAGAGGAR